VVHFLRFKAADSLSRVNWHELRPIAKLACRLVEIQLTSERDHGGTGLIDWDALRAVRTGVGPALAGLERLGATVSTVKTRGELPHSADPPRLHASGIDFSMVQLAHAAAACMHLQDARVNGVRDGTDEWKPFEAAIALAKEAVGQAGLRHLRAQATLANTIRASEEFAARHPHWPYASAQEKRACLSLASDHAEQTERSRPRAG